MSNNVSKFFSGVWGVLSGASADETVENPIPTVARWQTLMLIFSVILIITAGVLAYFGVSPGIVLFGSFVGFVGGITNNHFRCLKLMEKPKIVPNLHQLRMQILFSPIIGGVFAALFYLGAAADLIAGEMFPKFAPGDYEDFRCYINTIQPQKLSDTSKLLFWCFVAGFSERFMPNYLDRLAKESNGDSIHGDQPPKENAKTGTEESEED